MATIEKGIVIDAPVEKVFAFMAEPNNHKMNQHESETVLANLKARMEIYLQPFRMMENEPGVY